MLKLFRLLALALLTTGLVVQSSSGQCIPTDYLGSSTIVCDGGSYPYAGFMTKVQVGSFVNSTGCTIQDPAGSGAYHYANYSSILSPITLLVGSTTTFIIEAQHNDGSESWSGYPGAISVWIDINNNGSFTDAGEKIISNITFPQGKTGVTYTLPTSTTQTGIRRMRVRASIGTYYLVDDPCCCNYGETEDYSVNLLPPLADPTPTGIALTNVGSSSGVTLPAAAGNYDLGFTLSNQANVALVSMDYDYTVTSVATGTVIATGTNVGWTGSLIGGGSTIVKLVTNIAINNPLNPMRVQVTVKNAKSAFAAGDNNNNNNTLDGFIGPALNGGDYYVGNPPMPTNWFATPQDAAVALTYGGILGPVNFYVRPGTYPNTQMTLGQVTATLQGIPGGGPSNPVTFLRDPAYTGTITFQAANNAQGTGNFLVQVNGSVFTTMKDITFEANPLQTASRLFWLRNTTRNLTLTNCVFNGVNTTITGVENSLINAELGNVLDGLTITNSTFNNGDAAMYLDGGLSVAGAGLNVLIKDNQINNFYSQAIYMRRYNLPRIDNNRITTNSTNATPVFGLNLESIQTGGRFERNRITFARTGTGIRFISNNTDAGNPALMANNMIKVGNGTSNTTFGISALSFVNTNIFQNTIIINAPATTLAAALNLSGASTNSRIVNNIFYNTGLGYAYSITSGSPATESNYNNLWNAAGGVNLGYYLGTYNTLALFRSATARETNSQNVAISFIGSTGTYLPQINSLLRGTNTYNNPSYTTVDIDNVDRRAPPYMGAHELIPMAVFAGGAKDSGCAGKVTTLNSQPQYSQVVEGTAYPLTVTPSQVSYQWTKGGTVVSDDGRVTGTRTSALTINGTNEFDNDEYRCNLTILDGATARDLVTPLTYQYAVLLKVNEPVVIAQHPLSQVVCRGGTMTLSVVSSKGTIWGYKWQKDGVDLADGNNIFGSGQVSGTNLVTLTLTNVEYGASGMYRCVLATSCGKTEEFTNQAVVYVAKPTSIEVPPVDAIVSDGGTARFEVSVAEATIGGIVNPVKYEWYRGTQRIMDDTRTSGAGSAVLQIRKISAADVGSNYSVKVIGACGEAQSQTFAISIASIVASVGNVKVCPGSDVTVTATATLSGATPQHNLSYQWMRGGAKLSDGAHYAGTGTANLMIKGAVAADAGSNYSCVVTAQPGAVTTTTVNNITVDVQKATTVSGLAPISVCEGQPAQLTVTADGTGTLKYTWRKGQSELVGVTGATWSVMELKPSDAGLYTVTVEGDCGVITSEPVMVKVLTKPLVVGPGESKLSLKQGGSIRLGVATNNDASTTYQWFKDGLALTTDKSITYNVFTKYDIKTATDAGKYWCVVENQCGTTKSDEVEIVITTGATGVEEDASTLALYGNEPNPFTGETAIRFGLPQTSQVELTVTDAFGREVANLYRGEMPSGVHSVIFNAVSHNVPSGVYYYTLRVDGTSLTKRMMFVK